jgi:diguanylate cyclase (GGDEF)-like protein/PAS domain S-box-containing protein
LNPSVRRLRRVSLLLSLGLATALVATVLALLQLQNTVPVDAMVMGPFAWLLVGGALAGVLWFLQREWRLLLGGSALEVSEAIAGLSRGDLSGAHRLAEVAEGSLLGAIAAAHALVEQRQSHQARALVDASEDAIVSLATDGRITAWNPGAYRIFGYTSDEALGQPFAMLVPADMAGQDIDGLQAVTDGEAAEPFETLRRRKDGSLICVAATRSPILDDAGRVIGRSEVARDITTSMEAESEIHRLATYDTLTELPNRRVFQDRLRHALAGARRSRLYCAILSIDLDNFKALNDTRGHQAGDRLLQQVAQRLLNCLREVDTVTRFGADEFMVMLERLDESPDKAAHLAERVSTKILATLRDPYLIDGQEHRCTGSIGIALSIGEASANGELLLQQADLAVRYAKEAGPDSLRFFDPDMQTTADRHAVLERELREALTTQQFLLHFQPQVRRNGLLSGAEVLVRWKHPERGMVSPAEFIPRAEDTGLILPLGQWVLAQACEALARWAAEPRLADLVLAVNVSARQFHQANFVEQVDSALRASGADPRRLKLELTESMLANDMDGIVRKMSALQALGVSISLDDFGTGYSSLSYLKRLPLDQLKIDQSFVRNILTDANDAAIARMVVSLADTLDIEAIAEGVETEAQREALAQLGCHAYQGYLFGRPMPADEFERLAQAWSTSMRTLEP